MAARLDDMANLPDWPLNLSDIQAAAYVGVSPGTFEKMVEEGDYPDPVKHGTRKWWFRPALASAAARLAGYENGADASDLDREMDEWQP
jgi:hypothetical protein